MDNGQVVKCCILWGHKCRKPRVPPYSEWPAPLSHFLSTHFYFKGLQNYCRRTTRSLLKWLNEGGGTLRKLYPKNISSLTCTIEERKSHKWFQVFGISTTVKSLSLLHAQTHNTWMTWSGSMYVRQEMFSNSIVRMLVFPLPSRRRTCAK
jgi:hypothetical protein